ncbi:DUF1836 domain-containing protein [Enterococcus timonensis]|uniref:DUF1836 domain-containing protein n=1 Tax=Enterococcus timonensis TaxID=1852364 RepID=UPI0008D9D205|nr:DUF1836 domain-containing protein [Enterococcus timonensis]
MDKVLPAKNLVDRGTELNGFSLPRWEDLPDFELYMDQVVTLVNRFLQPILPEKSLLTAAMVNNYVKQKLLPPPLKKKYRKEHLAYLLAISALKQVLSLPELKEALTYQISFQEKTESYDAFCAMLEQALQEVAQQMKEPQAAQLPFDGTVQRRIFLRSITLSLALKLFSEGVLAFPETKGASNDE